jgi:hypothetical protein
MVHWIAVGGPAGPGLPNSWDLRPLITVGIALYALRAVFHVRITPVVFFFTFLTAPLFLLMGDSIGYPLAAVLVFVTVVITAVALRRTDPHR